MAGNSFEPHPLDLGGKTLQEFQNDGSETDVVAEMGSLQGQEARTGGGAKYQGELSAVVLVLKGVQDRHQIRLESGTVGVLEGTLQDGILVDRHQGVMSQLLDGAAGFRAGQEDSGGCSGGELPRGRGVYPGFVESTFRHRTFPTPRLYFFFLCPFYSCI